MIKTRKSRYKNRMLSRLADIESGRWLGVVPKSVALMDHCKNRNYGESREREELRRATNNILKSGADLFRRQP